MWKSSLFGAGVITAGLLSLSAAGAQEVNTAAQAPSEAPARCVNMRGVDGYTVIDRDHVVLNGALSRRYLATLRSSCPGLRHGVRIGTSFGRNARVCNPSFEYVVSPDGFRCRIETIEAVESLQAARDLIEARAKAQADAETLDSR